MKAIKAGSVPKIHLALLSPSVRVGETCKPLISSLKASNKTGQPFHTVVYYPAREAPWHYATILRPSKFEETHGTSNVLIGRDCDTEERNFSGLMTYGMWHTSGTEQYKKSQAEFEVARYIIKDAIDMAREINAATGLGEMIRPNASRKGS